MNGGPHHCSVCSDAADLAVIRSIDGCDAEADLVRSGERVAVAVDLVPGVAIGDTVLVHQGVAIARVDRVTAGAVRAGDTRPTGTGADS